MFKALLIAAVLVAINLVAHTNHNSAGGPSLRPSAVRLL